MERQAEQRPAVLDELTTTQMDELQRQFADADRDGWNRLCEEYGWSRDVCDATWNWFGRSSAPADS